LSSSLNRRRFYVDPPRNAAHRGARRNLGIHNVFLPADGQTHRSARRPTPVMYPGPKSLAPIVKAATRAAGMLICIAGCWFTYIAALEIYRFLRGDRLRSCIFLRNRRHQASRGDSHRLRHQPILESEITMVFQPSTRDIRLQPPCAHPSSPFLAIAGRLPGALVELRGRCPRAQAGYGDARSLSSFDSASDKCRTYALVAK